PVTVLTPPSAPSAPTSRSGSTGAGSTGGPPLQVFGAFVSAFRMFSHRKPGGQVWRAKRSAVLMALSIDRVHATLARPSGSTATDWKSSSSRSDAQSTPAVQIGPVLTGVGSITCTPVNVAPPSVLSRYASYHGVPFAIVAGEPTTSVWYSEIAT